MLSLQVGFRNLLDRTNLDPAVKHLCSFRLDLNLPLAQRHFLALHDMAAARENHHDLAVDDMHARLADSQKLDGIPIALFLIGLALDDAWIGTRLAVGRLDGT